MLEEAQTARAAVRTHTGTTHDCCYIEDIAQHDGQTVTLHGWLHNRRSSGKIHFLTAARRHRLHPVRDVEGRRSATRCSSRPTTSSQESASSSTAPSAPTRARRAASRSTSPASRSSSESQDYPITPKEHGVDYLLDRRHLWIRSQRQQAILRVRHEVINAVRDFFNSRGFILADTPIFTPAACEGTTTLFPVQYFEDDDRVPDAERPALQRSQRDGARPRLLLRPDVPRREVEDAPPPHRVLDGRAGDGVRRRSTT